jgi:hypothetical protein
MKLPAELEAKILAMADKVDGVPIAAKAPPVPIAETVAEKDFQDAVCRLADESGWEWFHPRNNRENKDGYVDLTLFHPVRRRIVFAELKTETGRRSAAQDNWAETIAESGGEYWLWRPSDWADIVEILTGAK